MKESNWDSLFDFFDHNIGTSVCKIVCSTNGLPHRAFEPGETFWTRIVANCDGANHCPLFLDELLNMCVKVETRKFHRLYLFGHVSTAEF